MAGVARWKVLQNSKLSGSWQVLVARHCAKPPPRCATPLRYGTGTFEQDNNKKKTKKK